MAVEILNEYGSKLNCHTCDDKLKEERGHYKDGIMLFKVDGKRIFRCPLTIITPLTYEYLRAFTFYRTGLLPSGVGWINESNKFIQAMSILTNEYNRTEREAIENVKSN